MMAPRTQHFGVWDQNARGRPGQGLGSDWRGSVGVRALQRNRTNKMYMQICIDNIERSYIYMYLL